MPCSFLQLPPEIRNKVYRLLLVTGNDTGHLSPNVIGLAARNTEHQDNLPDMADSLPLLRTCKLMNRETSLVLYGSHHFVFDDVAYNAKETAGRAPICNMMFLYTWLQLIGAQNRASLRHISFVFTRRRFFYCPGELDALSSKRIKHNAGRYLADALGLLAEGHALTRIDINCYPVIGFRESMFQHLFRHRRKALVIRQLERISGFQRLAFPHLCDNKMKRFPEAYANYLSLKTRMEANRPVKESSSTKQKITQPGSLVEKIKEVEDKRDRMKQQALQTSKGFHLVNGPGAYC